MSELEILYEALDAIGKDLTDAQMKFRSGDGSYYQKMVNLDTLFYLLLDYTEERKSK